MSEKDFRKEITKKAKELGWRVYHNPTTPANRTAIAADGKGYPDLHLIHRAWRRQVFSELKAKGGKVSPEQEQWLDDLSEIEGNEVYVWYEDEIDKVISILGGVVRE